MRLYRVSILVLGLIIIVFSGNTILLYSDSGAPGIDYLGPAILFLAGLATLYFSSSKKKMERLFQLLGRF